MLAMLGKPLMKESGSDDKVSTPFAQPLANSTTLIDAETTAIPDLLTPSR